MARNRNRDRVIYDNDATIVTENAAVNDGVSVIRRSPSSGQVDFSASSALDTLAGYIMQNFPMDRPMNERGVCFFCGKETAYPMRKLCVDCMGRNSKIIYENLKEILDSSDRMITLE